MISDTIKYIGVDDLDIDLFESQYVVPEGMSYNSYLIDDEKIAVLDTADRRKGEEWKANLKAALNGRQPDYLVAHHMEPDHAALIAWMLETYPGLQLVCSAAAVKMLPNFFEGFNFEGRVQCRSREDVAELLRGLQLRGTCHHCQGGRYTPAWPAHAAVHHSADGALAGGDYELRQLG